MSAVSDPDERQRSEHAARLRRSALAGARDVLGNGTEAEDAAQTALTELSALPRFLDVKTSTAWLRGRSRAINLYKKALKESPIIDGDADGSSESSPGLDLRDKPLSALHPNNRMWNAGEPITPHENAENTELMLAALVVAKTVLSTQAYETFSYQLREHHLGFTKVIPEIVRLSGRRKNTIRKEIDRARIKVGSILRQTGYGQKEQDDE